MAHEEQIVILLLEDSNTDAELVKIYLAEELTIPPEVVRVPRLEDAIEALAERDFDVVLTDLNLPDSAGLATFQEVQRHARDTAIVILSGLADKDMALAALREGAQDFVVKDQIENGVVGRTIRFAVERSKRLEAFRFVEQILDSLPAHVAVLDADGILLAVNAAWRNFATQNHFIGDQYAVGSSYLDVCKFAEGECAEEAKIVADGIRSVILGESPEFWLEYPCHSETEQRWFQVRVSPFQGSGNPRVIVSHENITKSILNRQTLESKTRELVLAKRIQEQLLPSELPQINGYDFAGASFAADEASGDYFDFISLDEATLDIVVADVCGHGMGPALLMAELRGALRALSFGNSTAGGVLRQLNPLLSLYESRFITMFLGRLDTQRHSFDYANAGHNGFLVRASGEVEELPSMTVPLGVLDEIKVDTLEVSLGLGDIVLLATDGLEDVLAPGQIPFGVDRVLDVVRTNRGEPAQRILDGLHARVMEHAGGIPPPDDITIVVIKRGAA